MVHRPSGEPIRRKLSEEEVRKYRLGLLGQMLGKKEKGKVLVRNPREEEEQSESMELDEPSSSATLAPPLQKSTRGPSSSVGQEAPAKSSGESQGSSSNSRSASELAPAAAAATTIATSSLRHPAVASSSFVVELPSLPKLPPKFPRANLEEVHPESRLNADLNPPRASSQQPRMTDDTEERRIASLERRLNKPFAWKGDIEDWKRDVEDWKRNVEDQIRNLKDQIRNLVDWKLKMDRALNNPKQGRR
jgi:hypothetical protein